MIFSFLIGVAALEVLIHSTRYVSRWISGIFTTLEKPKEVPSGLWTFLLELVSFL